MKMEVVPSLKMHLLTTVSNVTVPQTSFLPVKGHLAMHNGALILYYVFNFK